MNTITMATSSILETGYLELHRPRVHRERRLGFGETRQVSDCPPSTAART